MIKVAAVALSAALGVAGLAHSLPAQAGPYVSVGVPVVVAPPVIAYAPGVAYPYPYFVAHGPNRHGHRYWGYGRFHPYHR